MTLAANAEMAMLREWEANLNQNEREYMRQAEKTLEQIERELPTLRDWTREHGLESSIQRRV